MPGAVENGWIDRNAFNILNIIFSIAIHVICYFNMIAELLITKRQLRFLWEPDAVIRRPISGLRATVSCPLCRPIVELPPLSKYMLSGIIENSRPVAIAVEYCA